MNLIPLCLAVTVLGADVAEIGWAPLPEGGMQYQVQLTPRALDALRAGQEIIGPVPPQLKDIREYRITVGEGRPERRLPPGQLEGQPRPPADERKPDTAATENPKPYEPPAMPRNLPPVTASKPLPETQAAYATPPEKREPPRSPALASLPEPSSTGPQAAPPPEPAEAEKKADTAEPTKSWWAWTAVLSVGLNFFLGWTTWDYRRRYQEVVSGDRPVIVPESRKS